jgi:hypothetical protein
MAVDSYTFGRIVVNGKTYTHDVIIAPDGTVLKWWRKKGHELSLDDLKDILDREVEVLVIGTGSSGVMKVPGEVVKGLEAKGIEVTVEKTKAACDVFNRLSGKAGVWAAFHLTC